MSEKDNVGRIHDAVLTLYNFMPTEDKEAPDYTKCYTSAHPNDALRPTGDTENRAFSFRNVVPNDVVGRGEVGR